MVLQDIRYSFHALRKSPGFTLAAVLSLAIGIGANTAIFSVADALFLHPLPYDGADRLVILWNRSPGLNIAEDWFSTAQYFDIRNGHKGFEQLALAIGGNQNLTGYGKPERVGVVRVSSNLLPMLGVRAVFGRLFTAQDDSAGAARTALLSHGIWTRRYGSDANMVGKSITLNGQSCQVIGILPRSFSLPREVMPTLGGAEDAEIILSLPLAAAASTVRSGEDYNIIGKLKREVDVRQAQAEMDGITARLRGDYPQFYPPNGGLTFSIVPLQEQVTGDVRRPVAILGAATALVLLIACANMTNLSLARAVSRQREIAIRSALGAGRGRLTRLLLTESVILALMGGAAGVVLSGWTIQLIQVLGPSSIPRISEISLNGRVMVFTLIVSLFSGLLFGLAPALRVSRINTAGRLHETGRGSSAADSLWGRGNNLRRMLVVTELALSLMLLTGAGLLIRSFIRLQDVNAGFNPANVLTMGVTMTGQKYSSKDAILETYHQLWERLDTIPSVSASGGITALPLSRMFAWGPIVVEGRVPAPGEQFINADLRVTGGRYFEVMGIPLLQGRLFNEQDSPGKDRVAIIDDYMAQQLWPGQEALGKRFRPGGIDAKMEWITVVGVVGQVKHESLESKQRIAFYLPQTQYPAREMNIVIRSGSDPAALASAAVRAVNSVDSDLPVYRVATMEQRVTESLARRRFSMVLLGLFAAMALTLAVTGVYGVMAYLVSQGTREIGVRTALGATQGRILKLVFGRAALVSSAGLAAGLAGAFIVGRYLESLLFETGARDPLVFAGVTAILAASSLAAGYIPARRASRTNPVEALRAE